MAKLRNPRKKAARCQLFLRIFSKLVVERPCDAGSFPANRFVVGSTSIIVTSPLNRSNFMSTFFRRHSALAATLEFAAVLAFSVTQLRADTQLFYNGGYDTSIDTYYTPGDVTDQFTVSPAGTYNLTTATVYLSPSVDNTPPTSISWSVGTSQFGNQIGSGTSLDTYTTLVLGSPGYVTYYVTTFDISETLPVSSGTPYYLTLNSASNSGSPGETFGWEESEDTTTAYYSTSGNASGESLIFGEAFSINGNSASSVPEPGSFIALVGLGAMGLVGCVWRQRRAK
jgi:hypothetical protein